jgi:hypothetical protein
LVGVAGPDVSGQRLGAVHRGLQICVFSSELIEECITHAKFADLVGFHTAEKLRGMPSKQ